MWLNSSTRNGVHRGHAPGGRYGQLCLGDTAAAVLQLAHGQTETVEKLNAAGLPAALRLHSESLAKTRISRSERSERREMLGASISRSER